MPAVTVLGPESTGKTTLAAELARRLGAVASGEAARGYLIALGGARPLGRADVMPIARAQAALEDAADARAAAEGRVLVVRDTDLVSTAAYAWWYYRLRDPWLDDAARARRARHYLLCDVDLPWVPDQARDPAMADAGTRGAALAVFVDELARHGCAWSWVRGAGEARIAAAVRALTDAGLIV
jgi:nicotinamide riboside kinase